MPDGDQLTLRARLCLQTYCYACASGTFSNGTGATDCTRCPAGQYSQSTGSTSGPTNCTLVPPRPPAPLRSPADPLSLRAVRAGSIPARRRPAALPRMLARHHSQPVGYWHALSVGCLRGYHRVRAGLAVCLACSPGFFAATQSSTSCSPCAVGLYTATSGALQCLACPVGSFTNQTAVGRARLRDDDRVADARAACRCRSARCARPASSSRARARAPASTAAPERSGPRRPIHPPTHSTADSHSAREPRSNAPAQIACSACPEGTSAPNPASTFCTPCSPGFYQVCRAVRPRCGKRADNSSTTQSGTQQTSCLSCQAGTYTSSFAQAQCTPCGLGQFASQQVRPHGPASHPSH